MHLQGGCSSKPSQALVLVLPTVTQPRAQIVMPVMQSGHLPALLLC